MRSARPTSPPPSPPASSSGCAEDYQWPSVTHPRTFRRGLAAKRAAARIRAIEDSFERRVGCHAVLFPSARSGLSMILRLHRIGRMHTVHAPRWCSYCVWALIGRYANPTVGFDEPPDVLLPVHRWAQVSRLSRAARPPLVVEDSVDSLFVDGRSLFPNGGRYEVLSLPKIVASYCGGVVLTREAAAAEALRGTRSDGAGLAAHQSYLKYLWAAGRATRETRFQDWSSTDWNNTGFDENALAHIEARVRLYDEHAAVLRRRLDRALAARPGLAKHVDTSTGRLPPVIAIPLDACEPIADLSRWMLRRKNCGSIDRPDYRQSCLLPLHVSIGEDRFEAMLAELRLKGR